jgi:hypothetical protein
MPASEQFERCARRLLLLVAVVCGLTVVSLLAEECGKGDARRKGRPRSQVTYKGSSPYFKVDFDRYTGAVTCVWCHPKATAVWEKEEAFHRDAYRTLDEKSRAKPECVKCHVTAYNRDGVYPFEVDEEKRTSRKMGFTWGGDAAVNDLFIGVQCEACHGPNCGNKYSEDRLAEICEGCHNEESPTFEGFDAEEAMKRMKHAAVGADEKVEFDTYAGVDSCFMCHWPNYRTWKESQGPHARAFEALDEKARRDPNCLKCHTTGFSSDGVYPLEEAAVRKSRRSGYELGGPAEQLAKFEGVQCEACHGINCGTHTTKERIRKQCEACHSGACEHDDGFDWKRDFPKVMHRPPADYEDTGERKVLIEWYDLEQGLETAASYRMPLLVIFSNPPDG